MVKCRPGSKERDAKISLNPCFRCIRDTPYSDKYDFVYECAHDVMEKMTSEEVNELAKQVLDAIRENFSEEADFEELRLLGDCFARVFMYTLTRGHYYRGAFENLHEVRETLYIAAEVSMPANGVVSIYERDYSRPFPKCWLDMNRRGK